MTDPIKQPIYEEAIASIEKWTAIIDFITVKWTHLFGITLNIIIVAVTYYTTGLTDEMIMYLCIRCGEPQCR